MGGAEPEERCEFKVRRSECNGQSRQYHVATGPGVAGQRSAESTHAYSLFVQDDWRWRGNVTVDFGVRYEYLSPVTEDNNHLVNLDVAPDFSAVVPVFPGETGPYSGVFPRSLVHPDRNNVAPRVGIAWRAPKQFVVRSGYSVSYNAAQYTNMRFRVTTSIRLFLAASRSLVTHRPDLLLPSIPSTLVPTQRRALAAYQDCLLNMAASHF